MRKLIPAVTTLLALALIFAGAFLPQITAFVMDRAENGKIGSAPMQSVELNLRDRTQPNDMVRKLKLVQRMYTVPVDASETSMTVDEVYAAVERCMADYVDAGIFEWFQYTTRAAEPLLGIDSQDIHNTGIFWGVTYVNEKAPYQALFVHIDDENGKIYYLSYEDYEKESIYSDRSPEYAARMNFVLDHFTEIFFDQLGLADVKKFYDSKALVEEEEVDGGVYLRRYVMEDDEYGEISIEFYANPSGFRLYYHS